MGGMFIAEFAGGKPWAHIDIAASAWNTNDELTTILRGPSGAGTRLCIELAELDRKSTRLNSSHRCISYAVFCLKKKTTSRLPVISPTTIPACTFTDTVVIV